MNLVNSVRLTLLLGCLYKTVVEVVGHQGFRKVSEILLDTTGDGFCLDSSISLDLTGSENFKYELRLLEIRTMIEQSELLEKEAQMKDWSNTLDPLVKEIGEALADATFYVSK